MGIHDPSPYANLQGKGQLYLVVSKVDPPVEIDGELTDQIEFATVQESEANAVKRHVWHAETTWDTRVREDQIYITEYDGGEIENPDFRPFTDDVDLSEIR